MGEDIVERIIPLADNSPIEARVAVSKTPRTRMKHSREKLADAVVGEGLDAVLARLPEGADWRRFTPVSISVYAASPYNAKAQVRYDGYGDTPAEQLADAIAKMNAARAAKALRSPGSSEGE